MAGLLDMGIKINDYDQILITNPENHQKQALDRHLGNCFSLL